MEAGTAYIFLIIYMFYMLHAVHDLRSRLSALQSQFIEDKELIVVSFIGALDAGDVNRAVEAYQKLSGCSTEHAKTFVEGLRTKNEAGELISEPNQR